MVLIAPQYVNREGLNPFNEQVHYEGKRIADDLNFEPDAKKPLDEEFVKDFIVTMFTREGVELPDSIRFTCRIANEQPALFLEGNELRVCVATEEELKRLSGRYVIRRIWSYEDWLLATRPGHYIRLSALVVFLLSAGGYMIAMAVKGDELLIALLTGMLTIAFALWSGYEVSLKSVPQRRKFAEKMSDLRCMTEFDIKDYTPDHSIATHGGLFLLIFAALTSSVVVYASNVESFMPIPFLLIPLFIGLVYLIKSGGTIFDEGLCDDGIDWDDENAEDLADAAYEDSELLRISFARIIDELGIRDVLIKKHEAEFIAIRARFCQVKYAHCWSFYDYVEDGVLFLDSKNLSLEAALRRGAATLAASSLPFYSQLSLNQRAVHVFALFFGFIMIMPLIVVPFMISNLVLFPIGIFTSVIFSWLWYIGWKYHEGVRRNLPSLLKRTGIYIDWQAEFYAKSVFPSSRRGDMAFLIGFHVVLFMIGLFVFLLS